jgi:hypothetical protein
MVARGDLPALATMSRKDVIAVRETIAAARYHLRGKNLACHCSLLSPCHADVYLAVANGRELSARAVFGIEHAKAFTTFERSCPRLVETCTDLAA